MDDRLTLPPDQLRRFGHRVVDLVVDHLSGLRDEPPVRTGDRAALEALLREPPPEEPGDLDAAVDLLAHSVLTHMQHSDHPRYFARVPSPSNGVAALGDVLAAGFNVFATSWAGGSGPTVLELVVVDWLRELCGLPDGTEGVLLSGGSVSALTALATARAECGGDVAYLSDQTHASNARALRILGVPHVRVLETDDAYRLPADAVRAAIAEDRRAGRAPFCVIGTAGTTNTGAVDPLAQLAAVCRDEQLWFHVDGAYGAPAALTAQGRALLGGLEHADSLCLDPHKWLFQPVEVGSLLVRRPGALARTFAMAPEYLRDVAGGEVNLRDRGPQLSRGTRAIKLWLTVKAFGVGALRDGIARGIALAERAQAQLEATPGWEIVTPAQLAVVTFRRAGDDALTAALAGRAVADGYAAPSSTVLRGRPALRLCTINPRTTDAEIDETVARLTALALR
jgi:glutamate/tyrosine decarboxylase-like PLP-dependent enzyme